MGDLQEAVDFGDGLLLALRSEMEIDGGGFEAGVAEVALDGGQRHTGFQQMSGIVVAEGVEADAAFGDAGAEASLEESALDTGTAHGSGGGGCWLMILAGGGKQQAGMAVGFPILTQQQQRLLR